MARSRVLSRLRSNFTAAPPETCEAVTIDLREASRQRSSALAASVSRRRSAEAGATAADPSQRIPIAVQGRIHAWPAVWGRTRSKPDERKEHDHMKQPI